MPFPSSKKILAAAVLAALASGAQSAVIYSLADSGRALVRFDSAAPGVVTTLGPVSGAVSTLNGLDFRPANGALYGYSRSSTSDNIYLVNINNGMTTFVSTSTVPVTTGLLGIDFNPMPDRLRVVTVNDDNRRINVTTGAAIPDSTLVYAAGDLNAGADPFIIDAAYSNNRPGTPITTLYYIDYELNILVKALGSPNNGMLSTVGELGVDANRFTGFDILTNLNGTDTAFASLQVGGVDGLYRIDLMTGNATPLGAIGAGDLFGLAVAPVPEPGSLALVAAAGLAVFGVRRRGAARATPPASEGVAAA